MLQIPDKPTQWTGYWEQGPLDVWAYTLLARMEDPFKPQ